MNLAEVYHREAVHFTEQAEIAKVKHPSIDYKALYFRAFELEKAAALHKSSESFDPLPQTWMMQSAAALALKAGRQEEASKTIALCRALNPDQYVRSKLDEIEALISASPSSRPRNGSLKVTGVLTSADAEVREIKIKALENQQVHTFVVPSIMFKNVVKSYWQDVVSVVAKASPEGVFTLQKISPAA